MLSGDEAGFGDGFSLSGLSAVRTLPLPTDERRVAETAYGSEKLRLCASATWAAASM